MKKILLLSLLFSTTVFAAYRTYDPHKDSKYINEAISGICKSEHQRYDDLSFDLKSNISSMNKTDTDKAAASLKEAERSRWTCIEKELNKKNITLDLEQLYKENNL
ncbi:hypothetical protein J8Z86_02485 [Yersinia enterocolitica]|uniref:hypothetical protein n=1 Tax=Yersinia enterocolitica TaxID=630 RepID=UPI001C8D4954|nr:hypothetical protein [Yersinia enterocolitica]MBX9494953.1 hypothetical protein [Yersinia enterocolitica]